MLAAPAAASNDRPPAPGVDAQVRVLAQTHKDLERADGSAWRLLRPRLVGWSIERARKRFDHAPSGTLDKKASEWFLDNYYLIRRTARQVDEELPRRFARRLPVVVSGPSKGLARIDALSRALVALTVELDGATLARLVEAYEEVSPLTIAELWALPTTLRAAVLHDLLVRLDELHAPARRKAETPLSAELGVERAVRALRFFSEIDWKVFFQKTNRVEAILRTDPALVYPRMDFDTCDSYRKAVELVAWSTGKTEEDVATLAITLCRDPKAEGREQHVGYYLVAEGLRRLEAQLGYRPRGRERVARALRRWPTFTYLSSVGLLSSCLLGLEAWALGRHAVPVLEAAIAVAVAAVPASVVAVTVVHWALARLLPPRALPKLDFSKGVPAEDRTLVVIPTLLGRPSDGAEMLRQIEGHYLSNPDPNLQFALLTDEVDRLTASTNSDLVDDVARGIAALNAKYAPAKDQPGPFHLLHREARWNEAQGRFMGWERKRGKLDELNRLLRGDKETSFARHEGDPRGLVGIRFVITLDSDTHLPLGAPRRLVGVLAHPLNRAVFDGETGRVTSGYTIVQPRVETVPSSAMETRFARIAAGDVGFDIYTHACSNVYQDLFGAGIYVGKGIYEVDDFMRSVDGRVPENVLASHDLFEGIHGRAALATDIVLFESYPSHYAAYARRMHRWVRGDWQLVPWLYPTVPAAGGKRVPNPLATIDEWKIVDNLRRSLVSPFFLVLLVMAWTSLPGSPLLWTAAIVAALLAPTLPALGSGHRRLDVLQRCGLALAFLAHEASIVTDAIARVAWRSLVSKKNLLEWTSAAHTADGLANRSARKVLWREMIWSPILAALAGALVFWLRPSALVVAAPLVLSWLLAPEIARWASSPVVPDARSLSEDDRRKLRSLARSTWNFFESFVGPGDQWLPIDNYQEQPQEQVAHRTSPTNIGMMLLSTLSAYDLGYLGPSELTLRLRRSFETIERLEHYQGHLLNWYDTRNLTPLLPRYVSTVDSGNFAGALFALKAGCHEIARAPIVRARSWEGLGDLLDLLGEALAPVPRGSAEALLVALGRVRNAVDGAIKTPSETYATLRALGDRMLADLDAEVYALVETGSYRHELDMLRSLHRTSEGIHRHVQQMRWELDTTLPWLSLREEPAAAGLDLQASLPLQEIPSAASALGRALDAWEKEQREGGKLTAALEASAVRLRVAFQSGERSAVTLCEELVALAALAEREAAGIDYRLVYDGDRRLFRIGYNVTADRTDANFYDLLASEARLASYLAIVKRDVPELHWYALGRPMTGTPPPPALLSWGGTMFEFLMPSLLMRSQPGTLLDQTYEHVVKVQIAYGEENHAPWGISESAFAHVDGHNTYQYRSFGVPGLGFKRGLEEDHVVAPYASLLAASVKPRDVVANIRRLESMGMGGAYGLFEAVDLRSEAVPEGRPCAVVRSYMAHHQGMILVAINNLLNDQIMVDRFHADPVIESGALLLNERAPLSAPNERPKASAVAAPPTQPVAGAPNPWTPDPQASAQAFVVSNGDLTSLLTTGGGGGLRWRGLALTRYQPDPTRNADGIWLYLRDDDTGTLWMATSDVGRTTYSLHKAEFHHRQNGISAHVDVTVAAVDDVEIRQIRLRNESDQPRRLTITSAGEPALCPAGQVGVHPAFSRMFIESERVADMDALVFTRRTKGPGDDPVVLVHALVREAPAVRLKGFETDRSAFFGRGGGERAPKVLTLGAPKAGRTGAVVDPIMSLSVSVEMRPSSTATLAFVTAAAPTRALGIELVKRYGSMHAVRWAFRDSDQESRRRLQRSQLEPELVPSVQRLFSALHFADPAFRVAPAAIAAGRPSKRRLWGRGISGDDPILLVRVRDPRAAIVREVILAQRYLRSSGIKSDLVLLDEEASGYSNDGLVALRAVVAECEAEAWVGRHGGIYLLAADQLPGEERLLLEAAAHVVVNSTDGSLTARFAKPTPRPTRLPRLDPTLVEEPTPREQVTPDLAFANGLGGFTQDGREYVVAVRPGEPLPAPWCNVIANADFGCLVSESSLECTWAGNSGENRLTPWRNDPIHDLPSEALYLRDEETTAMWSPTPLPAGHDAQTLVTHGAGYTRYVRESHGLEQELTIFVPTDAPLKIARLRLRNTRARYRRLTATYYAEWVLGSLREEQRPYVVPEADVGRACLLASCTWSSDFAERVAFLASERPMHGFTTDRSEFLGQRGDYARPEALERWGLEGRTDAGADPCAALQVHLELAPGEVLETHFVLGQGRTREEANALVERFRSPAAVAQAWTGLTAFWDELLGNIRVKTPDPAMDLMLNRWLLYQTLSGRIFGRTGFYQSSGAFGFRDQLQDVMALLHAAPARARAHILESAAHQFEAGDVLHWWHPPAGRGVRTRCSDDMAWLPFVTAEYVRATGDDAILKESVPFLAGDPLRNDEHDRYAQFEPAARPATLLEHCRRALERSATQGQHGLPLMGDGDWNDGMNLVGAKGKGESVWLGWFLVTVMTRFAPLCDSMGDPAQASTWRDRAKELRAKIEGCAWDGAWYVRAFHDDGSLVGSATQRECRIDSIAQSWSVLSGGTGDNARMAVRAADDRLVREPDRLVLLLTPPFDTTPHDPGYIRAYPPGVRENGGQYTHAATWLGWAHAALGDGQRAERIFRLLNPVLRTRNPEGTDRYRVEPYVIAGDIYSGASMVGRGGWTWYTGAAAWTWRLGVEAILGLRKERGQLAIEPCIPPSWKGYEAWVRIGAGTVHVVVDNPDSVSQGIAAMTLDGVSVDPGALRIEPSADPGVTRELRVRMGSPKPVRPSPGQPSLQGRDPNPVASNT